MLEMAIQETVFLISAFTSLLSLEQVYVLSRNMPGDFTRKKGKMQLQRLLLYVIFRNCKDTNSELSRFYASIDCSGERPSRQATHKRLRSLNPDIWPFLSTKFSELFYKCKKIVRTTKNYLILAADSSAFEMPYSQKAAEKYGYHKSNHIKKESDLGKIIVRCGGLYDVINHIFVDYKIESYKLSETDIVIRQIKSVFPVLSDRKAILLADRGYISVQLMALTQMYGHHFCIRGKRSTYKELVGRMSKNDEHIKIKITNLLLNRIKDPDALKYLKGLEYFTVRVIKKYWKNPATGAEELTVYFTNLNENEFTENEILELYEKRWNIETAYRTLKSVLELERHVSLDPNVAFNMLYGKIMFYNFASVFRTQLEDCLIFESQENQKNALKYDYTINEKVLIHQIYAENLVTCFTSTVSVDTRIRSITNNLYTLINKMKTPIRRDRHYPRWGKHVTCSYKYKFRIDGRNHPKIALVGGTLITVQP